MGMPGKQMHNEKEGWLGAAFSRASFAVKLSKFANASCLALLVASAVSLAPSSGQSPSSDSGITAKSSSVGAAKKSGPKSARKRRVTKSNRRSAKASSAAVSAASANSSSPLTALTPHIDTSGSSKTDGEVTSVLKYGARKHAEGNYDEAEAAFRHVLSRDPANVDAFYDLGALAERKGDLISALSSYRAALALKPHDKEIADAVSSIEKTLRNRPAFGFRENQRPVVRGPGVPSSGALPTNFYASPATGPVFAPQIASPLGSSTLGSSDWQTSGLPPLVNSPQLGSGLAVDPSVVPAGTFQLSSAKNGVLAPTFGGTAAAGSQSAVPPVIGVAPRSHPVARQFLNTALNSGASIGLRAAGLHCPACHFMRFRF